MNNSVIIFLILLKDEFQLMRKISINEIDRVRERMVELVDGGEKKTKKMKMKKGRRRKGEEEREKKKGRRRKGS